MPNRMRSLVASALVAGLLTSACGGSSPTSPSSGGASISGSIVGGSSAAGMSSRSVRPQAAPAVAGMSVAVKGTSNKTNVDGNGRFALTDVPNGHVDLEFSSPSGFNSTVGLDDVQSSESISLSLSLTDSSVVLDAAQRSAGSEVQLEARVEAVPPETTPLHIQAGGVDVTTTAATTFTLNGGSGAFADLVPGVRVHVKGQSAGTGIAARSVSIQNTNAEIPIPINGIVQGKTGTAASFEFTIDGRLIKGDSTTEFFGNSEFADLVDGVRAEVKGRQQNGFVFAMRIHVEGAEDSDDDEQDESASIEGPLTALSGSVPNLTLTVNGTPVRTSGATTVQRKGDKQELSVLALNMTLHVVGDRQSDGSIDARLIQIKDDAVGGLFEMQGAMGGKQGTCPAISFGINGYDIVTDAATSFTPACSTLKNGDKVTVKGVVQTGGTVRATSVEK